MPSVLRAALAAFALALVLPGSALAATSAGQPFPTNLDTTADATQITGLRVDLPKPDCTTRVSDCQDIAVLDTLDGFDIQPRISIPFSGPIDLSTVTKLEHLPRRAWRPRRGDQPGRMGAGDEHAAFREQRRAGPGLHLSPRRDAWRP